MNLFAQRVAAWGGFGLPELAITMQWNFTDWAWGWCGEFADLGMAGLVLGPFQLMFEWSIL
jgi:hypothetical protein